MCGALPGWMLAWLKISFIWSQASRFLVGFFCTITEPYGYSIRTSGCDGACRRNHVCDLLSDCSCRDSFMEIGSSVLSSRSRDEVQGFFSVVAGKWYEQLSDNYLMTSLALPSVCVTISLILSNNLNVSHVGFLFLPTISIITHNLCSKVILIEHPAPLIKQCLWWGDSVQSTWKDCLAFVLPL